MEVSDGQNGKGNEPSWQNLLTKGIFQYIPIFSHIFPKSQVSSVQNPSIIPLNPGLSIGIPQLDYYNPQFIG